MKPSLRLFTSAWVFTLAACSGGGGSDNAPPPVAGPGSGKADLTYGEGGRASGMVPDFPKRMAVSAAGVAYITGGPVLKRDVNGMAASFAFGADGRFPLIAVPRAVDGDGNVYLWVGSIYKTDAAGKMDFSFGSNGSAIPPSGQDYGYDLELVRDATGNLYIASAQYDVGDIGHFRWNFAKFDRDGHLVASFGSGGGRTLLFRNIHVGYQMSLAVDSGGNLYIAGAAPDQRSMLVVKLDSVGNLAPDFAAGGMWLAPGCDTTVGATAIALDASGNVLVAGDCPQPGDAGRPKIFKLDSHGSVVSSFRDAGARSGVFGSAPVGPTGREPAGMIKALLVSASGDIYAAGSRTLPSATCRDFAVAKLTASGEPVRTFGDDGVALFDVADDEFSDIRMDNAGRLYVGGVSNAGCDPGVGSAATFFVYRLGA
jgi:hypothetical protein